MCLCQRMIAAPTCHTRCPTSTVCDTIMLLFCLISMRVLMSRGSFLLFVWVDKGMPGPGCFNRTLAGALFLQGERLDSADIFAFRERRMCVAVCV